MYPLIAQNPGFFGIHYRSVVINCRKSVYFHILKQSEIISVLFLFRLFPLQQKLELLSLLALLSLQSPDSAVLFIARYLGVGLVMQEEHSLLLDGLQSVFNEFCGDPQTREEELALLRHVLVFISVNTQIPSLSLKGETKRVLEESISLLEELIESTTILSDSPIDLLDTSENELLDLCKRWASGIRCSEEDRRRGDILVEEYVRQKGIRTEGGGVILFNEERCVLSLGDLPEIVFSSVNSYLVKARSLSFSALVP